jgi:hypothetical protein
MVSVACERVIRSIVPFVKDYRVMFYTITCLTCVNYLCLHAWSTETI